MADDVSKSGVFIDTKTGKVTNSAPEEGIQLVPPGGTIDAATAEIIAAAKTATPAKAAEPKTVTTESAKSPQRET